LTIAKPKPNPPSFTLFIWYKGLITLFFWLFGIPGPWSLIKIIYPEDYTNLLLRTLLIPNNSKNKDNAENFVDFLLSENNQVTLEDKSGLPSIFSKDIIENYNSKPIRLDTGLLVFLDNLKRKQFLSEWNSAISQ